MAMNDVLASIQLIVVRIDDIRVSFPQDDVVSVNIVTDINTAMSADEQTIGCISSEINQWPVFSLSSSFKLLSAMPDSRRFCVCFGKDDRMKSFAIVCDTVETLTLASISNIRPLFDCMYHPHSPTQQFFHHQQGLVFLSHATAMSHYLHTRETFHG